MTLPDRLAAAVALQLDALVDAIADPLLIADAGGTIRLANVHCERLFGWDRGELEGQSVGVILPLAAAGHHPVRRKDGVEFAVDVTVNTLVLRQAADERARESPLAVLTIRDATNVRPLGDSHHQNRIAGKAVASMSHELRAPLNSIIGFAQLMYDGRVGTLADDHREYIGDILTSARELLLLINRVVDAARRESGPTE